MARAICVFCGSSRGTDPAFADAATALGRAIGGGGHRLVYGGGDVGLMGLVAGAALGAGGQVTGVITESLVAAEVAHGGLSELEITASMHERKAMMAARSDAAIVLPGGFGTLDEVFELLTWNQLGLVTMPIVFVNIRRYFDSLFAFIEAAVEHGFVPADHAAQAQSADTVERAVALALAERAAIGSKWVDR
ncbi:MAG: TIGR00730 family Rossman fold protein [Ilumatobacteraceae bacterium]|nr:TIGR00730 family Rossman fold protein [Ilumatobacteraceae bacterium]